MNQLFEIWKTDQMEREKEQKAANWLINSLF